MPSSPEPGREVAAGQLIAVPLPNGHHKLIWVLGTEGSNVTFLVMEGDWSRRPSSLEAEAARPAKSSGALLPGYDDVWKGWIDEPLPADFAVVGQRQVTATERGYLERSSGTMIFGTASRLRESLLVDWRSKHDGDALRAEWATARESRRKKAAARREGLTLRTMLKERAFARWGEHWPAPAVREVRRIFRVATAELIALEKKGTQAQRASVLKRIVSELNTLDQAEGCIETVEREQVVARIEELASLVGLSNANEALTGHRDW